MIKLVRKANKWCSTLMINGKQHQEWFYTEDEAKQFEATQIKEVQTNGTDK